MSVQNINKKKTTIGVAIAAVGAAAIAIGVGTFASFSATQNGPDTTLAAGQLDFGAPSNVAVALGNFVPGGASQTRTMTFTNSSDSSLSGTVKLAFALDQNTDNNCDGDEKKVDSDCDGAGTGDLPGKLIVTVTRGETVLYDGLLSGLAGSTAVSTSNVAPNTPVTYTFAFSLPNSATKSSDGVYTDNAVQGDSVRLLTTATLEQS